MCISKEEFYPCVLHRQQTPESSTSIREGTSVTAIGATPHVIPATPREGYVISASVHVPISQLLAQSFTTGSQLISYSFRPSVGEQVDNRSDRGRPRTGRTEYKTVRNVTHIPGIRIGTDKKLQVRS